METPTRSIASLIYSKTDAAGVIAHINVRVRQTLRSATWLNPQPIQRRNFRAARTLSQQMVAEAGSSFQIRPEFVPKATLGSSKLFKGADEAVADLKSGSTILSAGFGLCGTAGAFPQDVCCLSWLNHPNRNNHHCYQAPRCRVPAFAYRSIEQCGCW